MRFMVIFISFFLSGCCCCCCCDSRTKLTDTGEYGRSVNVLPHRETTANVASSYVPGRVQLKIVDIQCFPAIVGHMLKGTVRVMNIGSTYNPGPSIIGPSFGIFVMDAKRKVLFQEFGGWGPSMRAGATIQLHWDTHANHLGATSEGPFLVPGTGKYILRAEVYRQQRTQIIDSAERVITAK